jgi:phosphoribosylformylglycinamidine cyclo-ligase
LLTYKKSGVDIDKGNSFVEAIKPLVDSTKTKEVLGNIGGFGGFFKLKLKNYKNPVLVSSTDGVGTKLKIAQLVNKHHTVGIDLVAMNVNDILCSGAEPLFFLDYIACGKLDKNILVEVVKGISQGCKESSCALIGGETAEMPGMYGKDEYDLAGFCVGVVEKDKIINGKNIKPGDKIIGLASSGLHSNGFSLVRKVFSNKELVKYVDELLKPTRIYVKPILSLLNAPRLRSGQAERWTLNALKGIAHITGGAFYDKIKRIIPKNINFIIYKDCWFVPQIFNIIQRRGKVPEKDMYRTFNMGIGLIIVVSPNNTKIIMKKLGQYNLKSWVIGEATTGKGEIKLI